MEELRNPLLGHLNLDDLNQRYSDTYCLYFGKPRYVHQFCWHDDVVNIEMAPINLGKGAALAYREPFRWEGLNVARPQAGWYFGDPAKGEYPFHLSYPVKKQYKRGITNRNVIINSPYGKVPFTGMYYQSLLTSEDNYTHITDGLFETRRSVIPRRDRALLYRDKQWYFWYRNQQVARIDPEKQAVYFRNFDFLQELMEVGRASSLPSWKLALEEEVPAMKDDAKAWLHFPEQEPEEGDEDEMDPRHNTWAISDVHSFEWVVGQLVAQAEKAMHPNKIHNDPPMLRNIGKILWDWEGIRGGGKIIMHYSQANDVGRFAENKNKKKLFLQFVNPYGDSFWLGLFHAHNPVMGADNRDDLYVIFQKAE